MGIKRRSDGVRPGVALLSAAIALGCALTIYHAWSFRTRGGRGAEHAAALEPPGDGDRGGRRRGRTARARPDRSSRAHSGGAYVHHRWRRETALSRAMSLHLPGPTFWRDARERGAPRDDPQLLAMWRSFHGLAPEDGQPPPLPFEPTAHVAELIDATGDVADSPNRCDVRVLPVSSGVFTCVVRVMCDGRVLYPNAGQTAGYARCEVEDGLPTRAVDSGTTARDGDPRVDLDLRTGTVRVEEYDATGEPTYSATLRISS